MKSALAILGLEVEATLSNVKAAYKVKMRDFAAAGVSLSAEKNAAYIALNAAYNEVKSEDKLSAYLRKHPWYPPKPTTPAKFDIMGFRLRDDGTPQDLVFMTPKDRRNLGMK